MISTMAAEWASFEDIRMATAPPVARKAARVVFYSGALAMMKLIALSADNPDLTAALTDELIRFMDGAASGED